MQAHTSTHTVSCKCPYIVPYCFLLGFLHLTTCCKPLSKFTHVDLLWHRLRSPQTFTILLQQVFPYTLRNYRSMQSILSSCCGASWIHMKLHSLSDPFSIFLLHSITLIYMPFSPLFKYTIKLELFEIIITRPQVRTSSSQVKILDLVSWLLTTFLAGFWTLRCILETYSFK